MMAVIANCLTFFLRVTFLFAFTKAPFCLQAPFEFVAHVTSISFQGYYDNYIKKCIDNSERKPYLVGE